MVWRDCGCGCGGDDDDVSETHVKSFSLPFWAKVIVFF